MVVAVMAFAGFLAGLLGIGGALIFNPVLLQVGVHPQVRAHACSPACHPPGSPFTGRVKQAHAILMPFLS